MISWTTQKFQLVLEDYIPWKKSCKAVFYSYSVFEGNPDDRYNLYMQYTEMFPKAQAPQRIPLSFTTGVFV